MKILEVIVSQMLRRVQVVDPGDTDFLPDAVVDKFRFRAANQDMVKSKKRPATAEPVLLGITKAALQSDSMISAASFQETTKVLTEAAIGGRRDPLLGLKENVILGNMVPTGTGFRQLQRTRVKHNVEAPTIAVAIIVENGGGSSAAAPIARAVIDTWLLGEAG